MKNKIVLFLLLISSVAFGQVPRVFTGKCNISQTGSGSGYWQVGVTNFNSPGGLYDASNISVNDKLYFNDSGILYKLNITTIISASGTTATIRVSNVGITGISSVPTTSGDISRGTTNYKFVPWTANMTDNDNQIVSEHSWYLVDSLLTLAGSATDVSVAPSGAYKGLKRITGDSLGLDLQNLGSPFVITGTDRFAIYDPEGNGNAAVKWDSIVGALRDSIGGISAPDKEVVFGTGPSVTSSPNLNFNSSNSRLVTGIPAASAIGNTFEVGKTGSGPVLGLSRAGSGSLPLYKEEIGRLAFNTWLHDSSTRYDDIAGIYCVYQSPGRNTESSAIILRTAQVSGTGWNMVWTKDGLLGVNTDFLQSYGAAIDSVKARVHIFDFDNANTPALMVTNKVGGDTTLMYQSGKFGIGVGLRPGSTLSILGGVGIGATYAAQNVALNNLAVEGKIGVGKILPLQAVDAVGNVSASLSLNTDLGNLTRLGNKFLTVSTGTQNTLFGEGGTATNTMTGGSSNTFLGYNVGTNVSSGTNNTGLGYNLFSGLTTGSSNYAFGSGSGANSAARQNTFCFGRDVAPTANNQVVFGSANYLYTDFYLGYGVTTNQGLFGTNLHGASITGNTDAPASAGLISINGARGTGTGIGGDIRFQVAPAGGSSGSSTNALSEAMRITQDKKVGIGTNSPTAKLHIAAGTTTVAPIKLNSGTNLTTPEAGAVEWDGSKMYITQTSGPTRKTIAYAENSFTNGGNSFGSTANLGTNDIFGLNLETNNTNRLRLDSGGRLFSGTLTDINLAASDSSSIVATNTNIIGTTNDKILFDESTDVISVQPDGVVTVEFAGPSLTTFTSQIVRLDAYASGVAPSLAFREDDANGTNEISLKAPATLGADYTQTLTAATGEIPVVIKGSGTLNFSSTTGGTCQDLTLSVTGVSDGDVVSLGIPLAAITTNGQFTAFVSGANTVNIRFCTAVTEDPGSGTFKVSIQK